MYFMLSDIAVEQAGEIHPQTQSEPVRLTVISCTGMGHLSSHLKAVYIGNVAHTTNMDFHDSGYWHANLLVHVARGGRL